MTRIPKLAACLLACAAIPFAAAQDAASYSGTWSVKFPSERSGASIDATLTLNGDTGTWKAMAYSKRDACIGMETPVAVTEASAEAIVVEGYRSKVLAGCKDWKARFKRVGEHTLSGEFGEGRPVTLTRTP